MNIELDKTGYNTEYIRILTLKNSYYPSNNDELNSCDVAQIMRKLVIIHCEIKFADKNISEILDYSNQTK